MSLAIHGSADTESRGGSFLNRVGRFAGSTVSLVKDHRKLLLAVTIAGLAGTAMAQGSEMAEKTAVSPGIDWAAWSEFNAKCTIYGLMGAALLGLNYQARNPIP